MVVIAGVSLISSVLLAYVIGPLHPVQSSLATWHCVCVLEELLENCMDFKVGHESFVSSFSLHRPLWVSAHPEKTNSCLGLWCKSALEWVLTAVCSGCLEPKLSWENNLPILSYKQRPLGWMEICTKRTIWSLCCLSSGHLWVWTFWQQWIDFCSVLPALGTPFTSQPWAQMQ